MKSFAKAVLIATLGLTAAGTALADSATLTGNTIRQDQSGNRNHQALEVGVVDMSAFGKGTVRLTNNTISQTQRGNDNRQTATIGKIDKTFGSHSVTMSGNTISQSQSGSRNTKALKVGVVE